MKTVLQFNYSRATVFFVSRACGFKTEYYSSPRLYYLRSIDKTEFSMKNVQLSAKT
jgi:hypothetical protein